MEKSRLERGERLKRKVHEEEQKMQKVAGL